MNKYVLPLIESRLKTIEGVLANSQWGRVLDEGQVPLKTYREHLLEEKREFQKAISILKAENVN